MLKVGINQWVGYQPLFLARNLGFYDASQIKLAELPSSTDSLQLLHTGELDAAALTLDETLIAIEQNTPLTIILIFDISDGADVLITKPNIKSLQELKGKRIGVESTAVGSIMLYSILKQARLHEANIRPVYLTADEHINAYEDGHVDAVITFEPSRTKLLKQGGHELFTSRMIPNIIVDVLAVRTSELQNQRANIQMLVNGYYKARHYMLEKADDAAMRMTPRLGISPAELQASFNGLKLPSLIENKSLFSGQPSTFEKNTQTVLTMLQKAGLVRQPLHIPVLQNSTFLDHTQP